MCIWECDLWLHKCDQRVNAVGVSVCLQRCSRWDPEGARREHGQPLCRCPGGRCGQPQGREEVLWEGNGAPRGA